jgi:hypothetical protein
MINLLKTLFLFFKNGCSSSTTSRLQTKRNFLEFLQSSIKKWQSWRKASIWNPKLPIPLKLSSIFSIPMWKQFKENKRSTILLLLRHSSHLLLTIKSRLSNSSKKMVNFLLNMLTNNKRLKLSNNNSLN